ncbi:MAG TPA: hypothetical protein VKZ44_04830 [Taishania sp.]|nr:hypothetical protein [Taishania sp.]
MRTLFIAFSVLAMTFACGTTKKTSSSDTSESSTTYPVYPKDIIKVKARTGQFEKESDPLVSIDTVEIRGNIMYIDVTYGGGCAEHEFELIGSLAVAKSMPPIRAIQLVHKANGDKCRALKQVKLEINIEDIAYMQEPGSEIYFTLEGWNDRIYYKYQGK